tara:strand:+ start:1198 stop:2622 length:1425 start_codon:yes stop_codon:yes gene_type:complete
MKILELSENNYYLKSSINFFKKKFEKRLKFIKQKNFLFIEISNFLNNCINNTKDIYIFCAGNSILTKNIMSDRIYVKEIDEKYKINHNNRILYRDEVLNNEISSCGTIIIADIEHQSNPTSNLLKISKVVNDEAKIIVLSKNMVWMILIRFLKFFFDFSPQRNNFLPSSYLNNLFNNCNLEVIRNEKIIALPINIPLLTNFVNKLFRLPILNLFCLKNVTILKKINYDTTKNNNLDTTFIIPCKNEADNIRLFEKKIKSLNKNYEYLFGDDNSNDNTASEIDKLKKNLDLYNIVKYDGPGVCKSENVYKGIEKASGDIIVIYDADLTVSFEDIEFSLNILKKTNADFINCTRMIYPQENGAMKFFNFLGNSFFASMFGILFKRQITDTLCGTKIFYKKDWENIKKDNSRWGAKDLWGDFDLLIGAYKNNLKIIEVPVTYFERKENETKMKSLIPNAMRMLFIVLASYYKIRLEK